jgi:hypothetical protein
MKKILTASLLVLISLMSCFLYTSLKWFIHYDTIIEIFIPAKKNILKKEKFQEIVIEWDKEIIFSECFLNINNSKYFIREDVKIISERTKMSGNKYDLRDICTNTQKNKFIFLYNNRIWRYDKNLDVVEISEVDNIKEEYNLFYPPKFYKNNFSQWKYKLFKFYENYLNNKLYNQGFWKRTNNIISISNYGEILKWSNSSKYLEHDENINYCIRGWTKGWYKTLCFINIFYEYNYITNKVIINKYCSYYFDDEGNIKTLEKCIKIKKANSN